MIYKKIFQLLLREAKLYIKCFYVLFEEKRYGIEKQSDMKSSILYNQFRYIAFLISFAVISISLIGCGSLLPSSGPSSEQVQNAPRSKRMKDIMVVEINEEVIGRQVQVQNQKFFSETFDGSNQPGVVIGCGDVVEVSVWEVPPALFGESFATQRTGSPSAHMTTFPEQMVGNDGTIKIPFAGQVPVAGRTLRQVETEIRRRLKGKANQPQVLVRMVSNNTSNVTVVGEVATSVRMPLTSKKERLLDALAAAGGVTQKVNRMTVQLTRGDKVRAMPLDMIIRDPKQNIVLMPDDVVTLLFQPLSFTALGATSKNEEVDFEAKGISLAQALARVGGLQDSRADPHGVFIFRFEDAQVLDFSEEEQHDFSREKVPVVYRMNLKDPATFFIAQHFKVQDKDVLYVSNAPSADFQKFLNMVVSVAYPIHNVINK